MPRSSSLISVDPNLVNLGPLHLCTLAGDRHLVYPVPSEVRHPDLSPLARHIDLDDLMRVRRVLSGEVSERGGGRVEGELVDDGLVVVDDESVGLEGNDDAGGAHVVGCDEGGGIVQDVDVGTAI